VVKLIIKLINSVSKKVNDDPDMEDVLKVIFVPNYNVSLAELLIPAFDISQHISTAGTEPSVTSNMKFVMNGGLLLGTVDGANVEIRDEIGNENLFMFGTLAHEVDEARRRVREGRHQWDKSLLEVLQLLRDGVFGSFPEVHQLLDSFTHYDHYLISVDWPDYLKAQERVDQTYKNEARWTEMSVLSAAGMGKFSSDRSIQDYAEKIWKIEPNARPGPMPVDTALMSKDIGSVGNYLSGASPIDIVSPLPSQFTPEIATERLSVENARRISAYSPSTVKTISPYSSTWKSSIGKVLTKK